MQKARINLTSTNIDSLNELIGSIKDISEKTKTKMKGPIPLPTKVLRLTTRKSPCGDGKASFDNFEMRIHKRLIELGVDERALKLVMRIPMLEGVSIEMKIQE